MSRKQKYALDSDDLLEQELFTPKNADNLILGVNAQTGAQLAVARGGTFNAVFDDQKLVFYDNTSKQIRSSALSAADILAMEESAGSGFYTGAKTTATGTDQGIALDSSPTLLASFLLELPLDNNWVWGRVAFTTKLAAGNTVNQGLDNFKLLLGDMVSVADDWVFTHAGPFVVADESDTYQIFWTGEGPIPVDLQLSSSLIFNIYATQAASGGADLPASRDGYAVAYFKGASPMATPAVPHGIPNFITPVVVVDTLNSGDTFSGTPLAAVDWQQVNITAYVPATATAVIIQTAYTMGGPDNGALPQIHARKDSDSGSTVHIIGLGRAGSGADLTGGTNQCIIPFSSSGTVRSFYYKILFGFDGGGFLKVVGYIS